tara:strand:+ start:404 stop:541 length:138 start_codon:yes stop_codon:yes gene_type:complete
MLERPMKSDIKMSPVKVYGLPASKIKEKLCQNQKNNEREGSLTKI